MAVAVTAAAPAALDQALRLVGQGWRGLLPILPPDAAPAARLAGDKLELFLRGRGKAPGRYVDRGWWDFLGDWPHHPDDEDTVAGWAAWPGVGIGMRACHEGSNVGFIDADILDPEAAGEARRIIRGRIGGGALVRIGRAPKEMYPVRVAAQVRKIKTGEVAIGGQTCAVEVLGAGGQAVVGGVHPFTGRPYHWPLGGLDEITPDDLPMLTGRDLADLIGELDRMLRGRGTPLGRGGKAATPRTGGGMAEARPAEELRARKPLLVLGAALAVRNSDWARADFVGWAYSLRGAFGDAGEALWLAFAAQSTKQSNPDTAHRIWASATKAEEDGQLRSGANAILEAAEAEGWTPAAGDPTTLPGLPGADEDAVAALQAWLDRALERKAGEEAGWAETARNIRSSAAEKAPPEPHWPAVETAPEEAGDRLRAAVADVVAGAIAWHEGDGEPPQRGIRAAAGLGKTVRVLEALAALPSPIEAWFLVPTVALAREAAGKAQALGLRTQVIRGREAVVDGEPLCRKAEEAAIVARAGHPVMPLLCRKKQKRGGEVMKCPFHDSCRYLAQFDAPGPAVRFFSHQYLWTPSPAGLPSPDLIVVDEAFALGAARHSSLGIDRLTTPRAGMSLEHEAEIHDAAVRARDLLEQGLDPRGAADAETFARMAGIKAGIEDEEFVWPSMRWEEQRRRLATLQRNERFKLARLWRLLGEETGRGRPVQRVELRRDEPLANGERQDRVHLWWRSELRLPRAPVLVIDASLDERLARRFLPGITVEVIAARRNAEVVQVADTACSRNRLLSFDSAAEEEKARASNRLRDVRHLAEVEGAKGPTLLVTYKAAEERLNAQGPIPGVDIAHFGALRGLDHYKGHHTIIVAGREQPAPAGTTGGKGHYHPGAEDLARSLFGDDDEALNLTGALTVQERRYRTRDGSSRTAPVAVHPDPRCQVILEQIRERETEQAIDRLRLIHRDRPARVILLSSIVVDVTVDRLVSWKATIPDRLAVAAVRLDGVLPLAPAWLAGRFPDLWGTGEGARRELGRIGLTGQTPNKGLSLGSARLTPWTYRVEGQRGPRPSRALIRDDHPSPETALAALVGPLALFRRDGEPPAPAACPPTPTPDEDFMDPNAWDDAASVPEPSPPDDVTLGLIFDPGPPSPLRFRGSGPPTLGCVDAIFAFGRRLVVEVGFSPPPPPPPAMPPVMGRAA